MTVNICQTLSSLSLQSALFCHDTTCMLGAILTADCVISLLF
jgi:hypothetical protein